MTLSEIARRIEEIRPGTLPESVWTEIDSEGRWMLVESRWNDNRMNDGDQEVADDIARHMLIGAMVMATGAKRVGGAWSLTMPCQVGDARAFCLNLFLDSDHGNDPLRSLLAAFERVYAKEDK